MTRLAYNIVRVVIMAAVALVLFAGATSAHDSPGIEQWIGDWEEKVLDNGGLDQGLLNELRDFTAKHICHFQECAQAAPPASTGSSTSSSSTSSSGMGDQGADVERWRGLVSQYGGWNVDTMLCLMKHESGGNPSAKNPRSSATGLFQILASLWGPEYPGDLYDPAHNTYVAHKVWGLQGYWAWSPYKRGNCR